MSRTSAKRAVTRVAILSAMVLAASLTGPGFAAADPPEGTVRHANTHGAIKDSYIVVFKPGTTESRTVDASAGRLSRSYGGTVRHAYKSSVKGFSVRLTEKGAKRLAANPAVAYVEQDRKVKPTDTQYHPPSWGLDRIDQPVGTNGSYDYPNTAAGVHAYIIDSGIRTTHGDFGGRASFGFNTVGDNIDTDCNGHGTHVAGTVGGSTYGVAKAVQLVAVKVLDCDGSGSSSQIVAGIDWVTAHAVKPAVANMSLGSVGGVDEAVDGAVKASIASGITYAVAAGNEGTDACTTSPADVPEALTVGATDSGDYAAPFSNYGPCVDLFAPGVDITSAWNTDDGATNTISGTSMATPHVTGAAAIYLAANPTATPTQVHNALVSNAVGGVADRRPGTVNRMLQLTTASPPPTSGFVPVTPARVLDTRNGTGLGRTTKIGSEVVALPVAGRAGVPATGVTAVVLNVTVTEPTIDSFLAVYPDGQRWTGVSNLYFAAGETIPDLVTVQVVDGSVDFYNAAGSTHIIADVFGYYTSGSGSAYQPITPSRVLDTRNGTGLGRTAKLGQGEVAALPVAGRAGVPATGVTAVVLNVTVTEPTARGFLAVYPDGQPWPGVSNLNFGVGATIPNLVTVPVVDGSVDFYNPAGSLHVIADVFGYYTSGSGSRFVPTTPARVLDTRNGAGVSRLAPMGPGEVMTLPVMNVTAVVLNVTITRPTANGFLAVYPAGQPWPGVSNLNFGWEATIPNLVVVPVVNGRVNFYNPVGNVDVIADMFGYFTG